jgi:hypothetical protein
MKTQLIIAYGVSLILGSFFSLPSLAHAQSEQVLSVTPPLFQLSVAPGDVWQSSIKVVNSNPYDLTVYAEVVNFASQGESGQGKFIPILEDDEKASTLAEWIQISKDPYIITREQTADIPFFVDIPKDASPGGHFAAILISTQPPQKGDEKLSVLTTQTVSSLFFVRIEGDIHEEGNIREFRAIDSFVDTPEVEFTLRFQNKGNVQLQPRGDIVITNMWGTERGIIPINEKSHFGNVLPESIRDFRFSWKGEYSITDIGLYKAIATLGYGEKDIKNVSQVTYFWVIPLKATLITVSIIVLFISLVTWMIKLYVRKMLYLAGVNIEDELDQKTWVTTHELTKKSELKVVTYKNVTAPITEGVSDLKDRLHEVHMFFDVIKTIGMFILQYKVFFVSLVLLISGFVGAVLYVNKASEKNREYEVTVDVGDSTQVFTKDQIEGGRK